ncbi:Uncharacterized protein TPAR_00847 [Tolypocladium paradoxum]|uniref:RCC1-like domain-containing protein n=1 Tax=Tolypocladium paradoxum TaxID=94208 RepID=A0A2S4L954_9HYPO|nr:Uncharacterized protein TPAR_00847 [Tolypocladium paradoxum]
MAPHRRPQPRPHPESAPDELDEQHPSKKAKVGSTPALRKDGAPSSKGRRQPSTKHEIPKPLAINTVPTDVVALLVFGSGENGELGLGPKQTKPAVPASILISIPTMGPVALTADNKIVTWGVNDSNALGRNTDWDGGLRDVDVESDEEEGELNPHESTPAEIPGGCFPLGTRFVDVAAGDSCSFALTDIGLVYGWGTFRDPEGNEGFGYESDGTLITKQETPALVQGLQRITQITCGANHALALDSSGNIWAWGSGNQNQFGQHLFGRHQERLKPRIVRACRKNAKYIASGEYHCFAVDRKDNVWGWGLNSFGQAGDAKTAGSDSGLVPFPTKIPGLCGKGVTILSGGAHHSAAVTADGQCLVWGRMDGGQLGVAFTPGQLQDETLVRCDERSKPRICLRPTAVSNVGKGLHVACGTDHTIFVNTDGHAYATGFGSEGQLGLGSDDDVDVAERIGGEGVKDKLLTWAGAGGQFSAVAAPAKLANGC